jgi:hypothetical protein
MAVGRFIDPVTDSVSSKTALTYPRFIENGIISKDKSDWPKDRLFIDDLEDVLNKTTKCHTINKCSTIKLYYITSPPQEVHANQVMSALITLSKQISDGKLASNWFHPMDLCAQFI